MKKVLLVVAFVFVASMARAQVLEIPNLEGSVLYDIENSELVSGVTSKLASYKDLDIRLGYTTNENWIFSMSYNLANLENLGADVKYLWGETHISLGFWAGYNFNNSNLTYGVMSVIIQINFI